MRRPECHLVTAGSATAFAVPTFCAAVTIAVRPPAQRGCPNTQDALRFVDLALLNADINNPNRLGLGPAGLRFIFQ